MKFLPFETITLQTKLTQEEIMSRLTDFIEPEDIFGFRLISYEKRERPYEGTIDKLRFKIRRITNIRTNIPMVIGEVENDLDKRRISLKMRLPILQMIALGIWSILIGIQLFKNLSINSFDFITLFLITLLIFSYIFTLYKFNSESLKAKIDLQQLWKAEEV
ncbi:hypothetical protein [Emticicia fontis]